LNSLWGIRSTQKSLNETLDKNTKVNPVIPSDQFKTLLISETEFSDKREGYPLKTYEYTDLKDILLAIFPMVLVLAGMGVGINLAMLHDEDYKNSIEE